MKTDKEYILELAEGLDNLKRSTFTGDIECVIILDPTARIIASRLREIAENLE